MSKYTIEVDEGLEKILAANARARGMSVEKLIELLLHRFSIDKHSMKVEAMKEGYEECGDINLEWANLK